MPTDFEELKQQLLQSNDEFRQLAAKRGAMAQIHQCCRAYRLRTRPVDGPSPKVKEVPRLPTHGPCAALGATPARARR